MIMDSEHIMTVQPLDIRAHGLDVRLLDECVETRHVKIIALYATHPKHPTSEAYVNPTETKYQYEGFSYD